MKISSTNVIGLNGLAQNITTRISLFLILNLIDYVLTVALISGGKGVEGNPLLGNTVWSIGLVKLIASIMVIQLFGKRVFVIWAVNVCLTLVIIWNLFWLLTI